MNERFQIELLKALQGLKESFDRLSQTNETILLLFRKKEEEAPKKKKKE